MNGFLLYFFTFESDFRTPGQLLFPFCHSFIYLFIWVIHVSSDSYFFFTETLLLLFSSQPSCVRMIFSLDTNLIFFWLWYSFYPPHCSGNEFLALVFILHCSLGSLTYGYFLFTSGSFFNLRARYKRFFIHFLGTLFQ